jgi:hypothetical protein
MSLIIRYHNLLNEELDKMTHQRARQLWNRVDVRNRFKLCVSIPGIRGMTTMGSLETLLKLRMSDVSVTRILHTNYF